MQDTAQSHILNVRGLHKSFGSTEVLNGVDFHVAEEELIFVIGPSGSGKSTLLRCCNRLEEATSGQIIVDGVVQTGDIPDILDREHT